MALREFLIVLLFISLVANASTQGYTGTVITGTGIIPALTVGKSTTSATQVGAVGAISSRSNLTGDWALDLKGDQIRHFDLKMYQEDDLILGTGRSHDQSNLAVNAAGSVAGDRPTIFITVIDSSQVFRLMLSVSGEAVAGEYDSISQTEARQSGTVTGRITIAAKKSPATALGKSINPSATAGAWVGKAAKSS